MARSGAGRQTPGADARRGRSPKRNLLSGDVQSQKHHLLRTPRISNSRSNCRADNGRLLRRDGAPPKVKLEGTGRRGLAPLPMRIAIGSRGSALALWQANWVRDQLVAEGHDVEIRVIRTSGDRMIQAPLQQS